MNKLMKPGFRLGVYSIVLACAACSRDASEQATDQPAVAEGVTQQETTEFKPSSVDQGAIWTQQVSTAIEDLAQRIGVPADAIKVREGRSVDWGSSALGCPEEGMNYTDAVIPGLRLLLEADNKVYFYHGENGASLFLCPTERAKAPAYGPGDEIM